MYAVEVSFYWNLSKCRHWGEIIHNGTFSMSVFQLMKLVHMLFMRYVGSTAGSNESKTSIS